MTASRRTLGTRLRQRMRTWRRRVPAAAQVDGRRSPVLRHAKGRLLRVPESQLMSWSVRLAIYGTLRIGKWPRTWSNTVRLRRRPGRCSSASACPSKRRRGIHASTRRARRSRRIERRTVRVPSKRHNCLTRSDRTGTDSSRIRGKVVVDAAHHTALLRDRSLTLCLKSSGGRLRFSRPTPSSVHLREHSPPRSLPRPLVQ